MLHICFVSDNFLKETGHVEMVEPITRFQIEAPGGLVGINAYCKHGRVLEVSMTALPSFVAKSNIQVC